MARTVGNIATMTIGSSQVKAKDVTIKRSSNVIDATSRASAGKEEVEYGRQSEEISFDIIGDKSDTAMQALRTAFKAKNKVAISIQTMAKSTGGSLVAETGNGIITQLDESQPEDDIIKLDVTVRVDGGLT